MTELLDERVGALWYCLPADSVEQIAARLTHRLGYHVNTSMTHEVLRHLRDHTEEFGWMCPLAKRGPTSPGRYMRVKLDSDGVMMFDRDVDRDRLETGLSGTVQHTSRMNKHQADSLIASVKHTRSSKYREYILGLAEDCEALSRKAARVAKIIQLGREAG